MTLTTEQKQAIDKAGIEPVRVKDPETGTPYVLIREDVYRQMRKIVGLESEERELDVYEDTTSRHANP